MLCSLYVSNYILIGSLETTFPEGLIIISGETGAGKSILLGALSLVLGAKADASMVGPRGDSCIVEAEFDMDDSIRRILEHADLPTEGDRLILRRTVSRSGRSRSFAGDEPVSVGVLQELSAHLIDIHSQHQTLKLADLRFRMEALDLRAGCTQLAQQCSEAWDEAARARARLEDLQQRMQLALRDQEYNQSRWERLESARLRPGELEELDAEQKQLAHAEEIKETLCAAESLLDGEENAPARQLREAARLLERAARFIPSLQELSERLTSARLELEDISQEVSRTNAGTEASPQRLEQVEERLSLLYSLMQKYGVSSVEELISQRDSLSTLVQDAGSLSTEVEEAASALDAAWERYQQLSEQLHRRRSEGAAPLSDEIQAQLRELDLDQARFSIQLDPTTPGPTGKDAVRFLFSSGGQSPTDVGKAASGGELSRIMLSLKAVMARFKRMPTLVFDEIDSGVSGGTADKMGSLVCSMGTDMQVFAITHLPQVAAKGNAHYLVSRQGDETTIRQLDTDGRVQEISRMLSGSVITPEAVANAKALLKA